MDNGASSYLRFLNDDREGFVQIVKDYKDGLVMFLDCLTNDIHIAEEAADETFLKLYVDKPKYKASHSFKTWLYTIGKNTALNYLKKYRKHKNMPIEDYFYLCDEVDIEENYIQSEEKLRVRHAIRNLKKEYAHVLYLVYFEDMTNSETAQIMGKSTKQVADLLYRAKNALKSELEKGEQNG
jgi:RNA polymerase sigma-70 factor (ECF subfamily)